MLPDTVPRCRTATETPLRSDPLELHNVLGHPNLPQSLGSTKLHHPFRELKFVGTRKGNIRSPVQPE